jgi:2-amino-4-hydroxy-6-hydroxymethyldihydropteridine diphosphokinase / dihydropteroate synthase
MCPFSSPPQGDRVGNLCAAIRALATVDARLVRLSRLYESAPAYVTDQPPFLNAAALITTQQQPLQLLRSLKQVEVQLGRDLGGKRWGPRPIDLDIIFYEDVDYKEDERLIVPHPRWQERDFVKAPLADLAGDAVDVEDVPLVQQDKDEYSNGIRKRLAMTTKLWEAEGGEALLGAPSLRCVMPMGRLGLWPWQGRSQVMGIVNVTPDSFSDGGRFGSVEAAVKHAVQMVNEGADILDVGGQSTRPGAPRVSPDDEAQRVLPVVHALTQDPVTAHIPLSVDTFYAEVAEQAVQAGATMVNDVSGGTLDEDMLATVARLGVPYVMMHMRGDPETMQSARHTSYKNVIVDVARELRHGAERAMAAGIEPWRLILDPGIGFAKTPEDNVRLVAGVQKLRDALPGYLRGLPMLVGPSRKGFLGRITGMSEAKDRDWATAAAAALCVTEGANIVRVHNVAGVRDACRVADSVRRAVLGQALEL